MLQRLPSGLNVKEPAVILNVSASRAAGTSLGKRSRTFTDSLDLRSPLIATQLRLSQRQGFQTWRHCTYLPLSLPDLLPISLRKFTCDHGARWCLRHGLQRMDRRRNVLYGPSD